MVSRKFLSNGGTSANRPGLSDRIMAVACLLLLTACAHIAANQHDSLDSPSRHVDNGMKFLQVRKIDAAVSEFTRATELNPEYAPAYTGLALAYARMGNLVKGYEFISIAAQKARGPEQEAAVTDARMQLDAMKIVR